MLQCTVAPAPPSTPRPLRPVLPQSECADSQPKTLAGTVSYVAPEVLRGGSAPYDGKAADGEAFLPPPPPEKKPRRRRSASRSEVKADCHILFHFHLLGPSPEVLRGGSAPYDGRAADGEASFFRE